MLNVKTRLVLASIFIIPYDNDNDALVPELWANEGLAILVENMVAGSLVYRDFENVLQNYGDVVNVHKPGTFTAKRKVNADSVTVQDASSTNVTVPLDQHIHTSFMIKDGEESRAFKDLVDEYLRPAILAQAQFIDKVVLGQYPRFLANSAGGLASLTTSSAKGDILSLRNIMNQNKAPVDGRNLILNSSSETTLLGVDNFLTANTVGDDGSALRNASLGRKLGFDMFMDQNMAIVLPGSTYNTISTGAVNLSAGYAAGVATIVVDGITGSTLNGTWFTIAGEMTPHRVTATTETLTNTTGITFTPALKASVANDAVITFYTPGAVNLVAGYAAGYAKEIVVDGFAKAPQVGMLVTFGTGSDVYTIISVTGSTGITLDRPLAAAIVNDATANIGPAGNFNFAFHKNAIALVVRPLKRPRSGAGALSAVVNWNDLSMRVVITYNGSSQGHLVTVDMLAGIAVLDTALGACFYG